MEIEPIRVRKLDVPDVNIFDNSIPQIFTGYPVPVTVDIGFPVVDIPGCVESRESDDLKQVDPRGNMIFCDGDLPSFNPIQYEPNRKLPTPAPKIDTRQSKPPGSFGLPIPKTPTTKNNVKCPTLSQELKEPIGTYINDFTKKIVDYKLVGGECIKIVEKVPVTEQIIAGLPSSGTVVLTTSIAVIATTSAIVAKPLANILLKVLKPFVKHVTKKIAMIKGKKTPVLSVRERRVEQRLMNHALLKLKGKE